jgi:hypothetical protein
MNQISLGRRGPLCGTLLIVALTVLGFASGALAGPVVTDPEPLSDLRGFVPTALLVGEGNLQVETSVSRVQDGAGTTFTRVWTTPTVVRFGMPSYEIRVQSDAFARVRTSTAVNSGMADLGVGIKGIVPQTIHPDLSLAVVLQAAFPSGSAAIKNNGVRPSLELISQWRLPSNQTLSGLAGVRSDIDANDTRYATGSAGVNYSHTWNVQFDTYAEFAAREIRSESRGGNNMMYDVGGSWRALPTTQLNISFGWGLHQDDTDMVWMIGVSRRFRPPVPGAMSHKDDQPEDPPSATTEDGQ